MSAKGKGKNVEALLGLIDAEGDFAHDGHRWLNADQPTIAKKLGCSVRTLGNTIKHPAFVTLRTRLGGKNVTLIRRANPKCANRQLDQSKSANKQVGTAKSANATAKSAKPAAKSAKIEGTLELAVRREELRQIWLRYQMKPDTALVKSVEYGLLLELAKCGITPAEFRYGIENWKEFLICVNAVCLDEATGNSKLKAYRPEPWLGTMVEFHEAVKEVYLTHQQAQYAAKIATLDKYRDEL